MSVQRLLVAVDGSEAADRAAEFALEIAGGLRAGVVFLHVGPMHPSGAGVGDASAEAAPPEEIEALARARRLAADRGVTCEAEVAVGDTVEEIADAIVGIAAAASADLIVVGSRGHGPIRRAVLGSVSREVLGAADVPVLVVKGRD